MVYKVTKDGKKGLDKIQLWPGHARIVQQVRERALYIYRNPKTDQWIGTRYAIVSPVPLEILDADALTLVLAKLQEMGLEWSEDNVLRGQEPRSVT